MSAVTDEPQKSNEQCLLRHVLRPHQQHADRLIGSTAAIRTSTEWTTVHRALNHGPAQSQMNRKDLMSAFHQDIQDFSDTLVAMKLQREKADYNPNPVQPFTRSQTTDNIRRAREAIEAFLKVPSSERKRFATHLLFGQRNR